MLKGLNVLFSTKPISYRKTQLLTVPRDLVYQTVLDVPSYSRFLPWCKESYWLDPLASLDAASTPGERKARLSVDFKLLKESYVSKVSYEPYYHIKAVAADSDMFETLDTIWDFRQQGDSTVVDFSIRFKFHRDFYQGISESLSHVLTQTMLKHFVTECHRRHRSLTH